MSPAAGTTVLVGGVSQLYAGDLDLGRRAVQRLSAEDLGHGVLVEDLHYGAVTVAQRLQEVQPGALVLVGGQARGRRPGSVERRHLAPGPGDPQVAVSEAVQGYVSIDLVVDVAAALGALPARVVGFEVEPASTDTSDDLSPAGKLALDQVVEGVRAEVKRTPVLLLAAEIRAELAGGAQEPSAALTALEGLLGELAVLDAEGRWGRAFAERDRLRSCIAAGATGAGMTHLDWGLWWTLVEELDRLQRAETDAREDTH
jgi:Ni,Fe-hydrogenase maturation factor